MNARVVVVTRTKNRPLLLERALRSIGAQTYRDFEVVVVNDAGAPEPVDALVEAFSDVIPSIAVIHNERSGGREEAMNTGVRASAAPFFAIHDDDDTWHPDFLARTTGVLETSNYAAVAVRSEVIHERLVDGGVEEESREILAANLHDVSLVELLVHNTLPPISTLFRRSSYDEVGGVDGSLPVLADYDFLLRIARVQEVSFVDGEPLAFWHLRTAATGDEGNSVFVAEAEHEKYDRIIRDRYLRESFGSGDAFGAALQNAWHERNERSRHDEVHAALEGVRREIGRVHPVVEALGERNDATVRAATDRTDRRLTELGLRLAESSEKLQQLEAHLAEVGRIVSASLRLQQRPPLVRRIVSKFAHAVRRRTSGPSGVLDQDETSDKRVVTARATALPAREFFSALAALPRAARASKTRPLRRGIVVVAEARQGALEEHVLLNIEALREFSSTVVVGVVGALDSSQRSRLGESVDQLVELSTQPLDSARRAAIRSINPGVAETFDELLLVDDRDFGAVRSYAPVFESVDLAEVDFWGLVDRTTADRATPYIPLSFMAVRRRVLDSESWARFVAPDQTHTSEIGNGYADVEQRFTEDLLGAGFTGGVAFASRSNKFTDPGLEDALHLIQAGLPTLRRDVFAEDPLVLDRKGVSGRLVLDHLDGPVTQEHILASLDRDVPLRALYTTASMMEVIPVEAAEGESSLRTAVIAHIFYVDLADELLDAAVNVPSAFDLYVTTSDEVKATQIRNIVESRADQRIRSVDVRVVGANNGRDMGALYVDMRDVLTGGDYDIIVKIHSKKSEQDAPSLGEFFRKQQIDNLLASPGYTRRLFKLFEEDPQLGMVFPPAIHMGYPTFGQGWWSNREPAIALLRRLGIDVPVDETSPLAPLGSMFVFRPEAIAKFTEIDWSYADYPNESGYLDGALAHVQERIIGYVAAGAGYAVRTVAHPEYAAISHTFMEYKLQAMSHYLDGAPIEQVAHLVRLATAPVAAPESTTRLAASKKLLDEHYPGIARLGRPLYRATLPLRRLLRGS